MSLFKKPKKNIRQRVAVNYSDEENETSNDATEKVDTPKTENEDSVDGLADSKENSMDKDIKKEKKKKKKHKEKAVISFIDEGNSIFVQSCYKQ